MPSIGIADKETLDIIHDQTSEIEYRAIMVDNQIGKPSNYPFPDGTVHSKLTYISNLITEKPMLANGTVVKSIQRGTIAFSQNDVTKNATIAAVNMAKTMLNYLGAESRGWNYAEDPNGHHHFRLTLASPTIVTATRNQSNHEATVSYEVIEFY